MKIVKEALAGTLESSDLMVRVFPDDELDIVLKSDVIQQFGRQIERVVRETLAKLDVTSGQFLIEDKGALDCVIIARVQTAVMRGADSWTDDWSALA